MKELAIVIPHFNGKEILYNCIKSLHQSHYQDFNVYVVDNGSTDDSIEYIVEQYPETIVLKSDKNLGYAGGCNYGYRNSKEPYVWFLNNDTEQEPDCLERLMSFFKSHKEVGAIQPKLISFYDKEKFDYSGACGGEIDYLGYPFARGRLFDYIEDDKNQYDDSQYIFWASGTAMLTKRSILDKVGCFDERFFAHMEEIDLCWRMHRHGYKAAVVPSAQLYHYSGFTLSAMNELKMYLNHRNNLLMMYKNLPGDILVPIFMRRLVFEFVTIAFNLVKFDFKRVKSVTNAQIDFFKMKKEYKAFRKENKDLGFADKELFYPKSIVIKYFYKGIKKYSDLIQS